MARSLPTPSSPAHTPLQSRRSSNAKSNLSLDLSDLPPLITPSPPTNTLLITNLDDLAIFNPTNLQTLRNMIDTHAAIHSWSPIRSFRRIIASFYDIESASKIKQTLDGHVVFDCRIKVYFGAHTNTSPPSADRHLQAPKVDKLFFISPPPSPPHDWEIRNEDPPNKDVHAEDLAVALSRLHARGNEPVRSASGSSDGDTEMEDSASNNNNNTRHRSTSITVVFHPEQHGNNSSLPAISVEDTTVTGVVAVESPVEEGSPMEDIVRGTPIEHTARPPVELMEH